MSVIFNKNQSILKTSRKKKSDSHEIIYIFSYPINLIIQKIILNIPRGASYIIFIHPYTSGKKNYKTEPASQGKQNMQHHLTSDFSD